MPLRPSSISSSTSSENGLSAYELAVQQGFIGSISEWLLSLKGQDGKNGNDGYTPQKNTDYFDGINGIDGYTPVKNVDYFDGVKGDKGDKGDTGTPGMPGSDASVTKANVEAVLTGTISSHSHAGGTDPFLAKLILGADKPTGANTTPVTLGLSFNYEANKTYVIDIYALVSPTATTTGCGFLMDVSSGVTYAGMFSVHQLAVTGTVSGSGSIGDMGATSQGVSSGMPTTGIHFVNGKGILITGANAGTATFFFRSETTAVTTCKAGTVIRVMQI